MAKLFHLNPPPEISFGGRPYKRSEDGSFDVPPEAVAALRDHGFSQSLAELKEAAARASAAKPKEMAVDLDKLMAAQDRLAGKVARLEGEAGAQAGKIQELEAKIAALLDPKRKA